MDEETIYSDNDVSVSTSRIVVRGTTYALRNISSVRMTTTPARRGCAIVLIIAGAILFFAIVGAKNGVAPAIILGGLTITAGVFWFRAAKDDYHVTIASNSGEVHAHTSKNQGYIRKIVDAVNDAIVRYR